MGMAGLSATPRNDAADALKRFEGATRNLEDCIIQRIKTGRCTEEDLQSPVIAGAHKAWQTYRSVSGAA